MESGKNFLFDVKLCRVVSRREWTCCVVEADIIRSATTTKKTTKNGVRIISASSRVGEERKPCFGWGGSESGKAGKEENNFRDLFSILIVVADSFTTQTLKYYTLLSFFLTNWNAISHEMSGIYIRTDFPLFFVLADFCRRASSTRMLNESHGEGGLQQQSSNELIVEMYGKVGSTIRYSINICCCQTSLSLIEGCCRYSLWVGCCLACGGRREFWLLPMWKIYRTTVKGRGKLPKKYKLFILFDFSFLFSHHHTHKTQVGLRSHMQPKKKSIALTRTDGWRPQNVKILLQRDFLISHSFLLGWTSLRQLFDVAGNHRIISLSHWDPHTQQIRLIVQKYLRLMWTISLTLSRARCPATTPRTFKANREEIVSAWFLLIITSHLVCEHMQK